MRKIVVVFCISILLFSSCGDDINDIGLDILPKNDRINAQIDTFQLVTLTDTVQLVLANNRRFLLGEFQHSVYGNTNGSLLAQFMYPQQNLRFPVSTTIDSMTLVVHISAIHNIDNVKFDIYELKEQLQFRHNYYTNVKLDYVDFNAPLGSITLSQEELTEFNTKLTGDTITIPNFRIKLGGQDFADRFADVNIYESPNKFRESFKGIFIQATSGNTILYSDVVELQLVYSYPDGDEIKSAGLIFPANNEVRQVNRITHSDLEAKLTAKDSNVEYIYAPAGFFTDVDIPLKTIIETTANEGKRIALNSARLKIEVEKESPMPRNLLLIKKGDMKDFFELNKLPERESSFLGTLSSDSTSYIFDLTYFTQKAINNTDLDEEIAKMVIVPVRAVYSSSSGSLASVNNLIEIAGLTLTRKRFTVVYNEFFDPRN